MEEGSGKWCCEEEEGVGMVWNEEAAAIVVVREEGIWLGEVMVVVKMKKIW